MQKTELDLSHFTGSDKFYRWSPLTRSVLTDGTQYVAETAGAFWLFDAIDSHLTTQGLNENTEFVCAKLKKVSGADDAELTLDDGNGTIWMTQYIPFTDFPLDEFKTFAVYNGIAWTHMLPSEY
jgi:hypothetical protein